MSLLTVESPKDCSKKGIIHSSKLNKKLLVAISSTLFSVLSFAFLLWLLLHPSKPQFSLAEATAYDLGLPNATIKAVFAAKNTNSRVGVYYDRLWAHAAYGGQPITVDSTLPPFYQEQGDTNLLSASLSSDGVPISPAIGYAVVRDQAAGRVLLGFRIDGQLRWKVGAWTSGRSNLNVDCIAAVVLQQSNGEAGRVGIVQGAQCATDA